MSSVSYALFDESGKFAAGRVLSESESAVQVEIDSGRRIKVKSAHVLLRFAQPTPSELLAQAQAASGEIDVDLMWDVAPDEECGFEALASEYFGDAATPVQRTAMLMRLYDMPHYFHRRGKGRFRRAPQEVLQAALAALEKKQRVQAQISAWAQALALGQCPAAVREQLYKILFKPDKNTPEYRAVVEASRLAQKPPLALLTQAGAIDSPYQFHWQGFLFEHFPKGTGFPERPPRLAIETLDLAPVRAFSIDDSATTEIDDALSVQGLGTDTVVLGIHIAAPALGIEPESPLDAVARSRWSTVYMPGYKLTMLPDEVVQDYTLLAGRVCPAVSLYVSFDAQTLEVRSSQTRLERVAIAANLRHDQLDEVVTEASLTAPHPADYDWAAELQCLFRLARHLKAQREVVRGKPETFNRPDYTFRLEGNGPHRDAEPVGDETVRISTRQRGAPLDLIVAEAMILANSTWGGWLATMGVPGIYRSQASLTPGIKVRMGTKALPHAGMGVAQYTWATSPLRRYVDLVNQWQIVACVRHGRMAALAAPFKPKDAALFAVISGFDAAYTAYNQFQQRVERYWTLRYVSQEGLGELFATVMKEGWVRVDTLPLVIRVPGTDNLPRGTPVTLRTGAIDLLTLEVHATLVARRDGADGRDAQGGHPCGDHPDGEAPDDDEAQPPPIPLALTVENQDVDGADSDDASTAPSQAGAGAAA